MSLMKQVEYSREAAKMLQRMDRATARRIRDKVRQYAEDPGSLANNVIIMKGGGDFHRGHGCCAGYPNRSTRRGL
jgi:mRNA interferase RelE/StbE